jgi:pimeloyl-ACP methyl ester carboxylesterase
VGRSAAKPGGYDAANLAEDIQQLAQRLKLERVYVAGHDIGGMVAYAFARRYPQATRGVMILDVPLPGIEPWEAVARAFAREGAKVFLAGRTLAPLDAVAGEISAG